MRRGIAMLLAFGLLVGLRTAVLGQEAIGDFYLFERTDPGSGEDRTSVTTLADENYVSGAGGLTFRCAETGFELVVTASYLGHRPATSVTYAVDAGTPYEASWSLRASGMAAVAPADVRDAFVREALIGETVSVSVLDFQMAMHTYTFHLDGLETALARLTCR